ncbi:MAG: GntR family transcriptional regulator [Herbaspirillum sp.]
MKNRKSKLNAEARSTQSLRAQSVPSIIADMRQRIASQALLPGSHIPEESLAVHYGVPRAKIREVLAALEDRGLVARVPNKGALVAHVDMETTYQLYEIREALDTLIVRLAMRNATAADWDELSELLGPPFEDSLKRGDIAEHVAIIMKFRNRLKDIAGNPILVDLIGRVYDRTHVTIRRVALLPGRAEMGIRQYREVLLAMRSNDAAAADRCVRELNESARQYIRQYKNYVFY